MNPKKIAICSLFLIVTFHAGASYAACPNEGQYTVRCKNFESEMEWNATPKILDQAMSRPGPHPSSPLVPSLMGVKGLADGTWSIRVSYSPAEKCAKISISASLGVEHRNYKRIFNSGAGTITDSGNFLFSEPWDGEPQDIGIAKFAATCFVPSDGSEEQERQALEEERERQELEEEQERLALEEEQRLEEERERLALEEEQERLALEEERERQRLAQQRRERERQRLAQQQRERERQRLAAERESARTPKTWRSSEENGRGESRNSREREKRCARRGEAGPMQRPPWVL